MIERISAGSFSRRWLFAVAMAAMCSPALAQRPAGPDLSIGQARYPDADAIILRWEQSWTIGADGAVSRREHQWVKLQSSRAIGRFADPRIEFNADEDEVIIHAARTHLADGQTLPVPDYSYNIGAAHDAAGWPAYAAWRQRIVSFSGIEPGVTLELDYEVKTKAGVLPWASALIRLDDDYPVVERVISVTVPAGKPLKHRVFGLKAEPAMEKSPQGDRYTWKFGPFAASPSETLAPSWTRRCPSLQWNTAADANAMLSTIAAAFHSAVGTDAAIQSFVAEAIKDETSTEDQVRAVVEAFKKRFNRIDSPKAQRGWRGRPAAEVFASNYGSRFEASAVLLAALRQVRSDFVPWVAIDARAWLAPGVDVPADAIPPDEAIAGVVLVSSGDTIVVDPVRGYSADISAWGDHVLYQAGPDGIGKDPWVIPKRGLTGNTLAVTGRIKLDSDGKLTGDVKVEAQGALYSPGGLATADAQKGWMNRLAGRLISGASAKQFAIQQFSPDKLTAKVTLGAEKSLPAEAGGFLATVTEGSLVLSEITLPLERSTRRLPVQLVGPVRESLLLEFELPEKATAAIVPGEVKEVRGPWGSIAQQVQVEGQVVRLTRELEINRELLTPEDYAGLRDALRDLQALGSTTLLYVQ